MYRKLFAALTFICVCGYLPAQTQNAAERAAAETLSASNEFDIQEARGFQTNVRHLLNNDEFAKLEAIADKARTTKAHFRGGAWKLHSFYAVAQGPGSLTSTNDVWQAHIARLNRWVAAYPNSPTSHIALARAYERYAWKARGMGDANTVTADGWKQFKARIQQAREILEASQSIAGKDPHWYWTMQTVALAQGWPRAQVDQLVDHAFAVEPGYYYVYTNEANYLLPRWYGKPGEAEEFAQSIADRVGGDEGNAIYFHIAETDDCCGKRDRLPNLSWDRVKQGFNAVENAYGSTNHQRNVMAFLAIRNQDQEFAAQMFDRIGDDWDQGVWGSQANFNSRTVPQPDPSK